MKIADQFLPEFDQEMKSTRALLERVPDGRDDYRPHEKSASLAALAAHLATLPRFGWIALQPEDTFDFFPTGGKPSPQAARPEFGSAKANLAQFDELATRTREAIASASDELMMRPWTLQYQGKTLFQMPRLAALRMLMMSHLIHHRGQLTVYLRMNDVPLPQIYGPTADEPM